MTVWATLKDSELSPKKLRGRTLICRKEIERVLAEAPGVRAD